MKVLQLWQDFHFKKRCYYNKTLYTHYDTIVTYKCVVVDHFCIIESQDWFWERDHKVENFASTSDEFLKEWNLNTKFEKLKYKAL